MGKFSIHIKHYKSQQLAGIDRHNRRLGQNHSNVNIDTGKSSKNLTLKPVEKSLFQDTKARIQKEVLDKGHRVTKASVWITEICATLPEGIAPERSREYFTAIVGYFENLLGKENIMSAYVHLDESRPHLHLCAVPLTEDGHLSRKRVWTRERLFSLHDNLPVYLREKGFAVERGDRLEDFEVKNRARMPLHEYKIYKEREKLYKDYNALVQYYNTLADKYNQTAREHVALKKANYKAAREIIARDRMISR